MATTEIAHGNAVSKIENVVIEIMQCLEKNEPTSIPLRYKTKQTTKPASHDSAPPIRYRQVSFPGKTLEEANRFTVLLRILDCMHEALINDNVVSKRNIFYQDPNLFKTQVVVDRYVDILAYTFGLRRADLNVTAAAKGLVAGNFTITHADATITSKGADGKALVIPDSAGIQSITAEGVKWVLVVEKESTFRTLASAKLHSGGFAGKGIILTAKGYPDLATRSFLRLLTVELSRVDRAPPICCLVDFDPDGIAIMSNYKYGSQALSHENSALNIASLRWLGVKSSDICQNMTEGDGKEKSRLCLSRRDRKKAIKMLECSEVVSEGGLEQGWRRELQVMSMLGVKAEMEALSKKDDGLVNWVKERLLREVEGHEYE